MGVITHQCPSNKVSKPASGPDFSVPAIGWAGTKFIFSGNTEDKPSITLFLTDPTSVIIVPGDNEDANDFKKYKDSWILAKNLKINIADLNVSQENGIKFFKNPNLNSDIVYQSEKFMETELIEINGLWAKVSFITNGEKKIGISCIVPNSKFDQGNILAEDSFFLSKKEKINLRRKHKCDEKIHSC